MELKKSKKADLERKRPLLFLIGMVVPVLVFVAALELVTIGINRDVPDDAFDDLLQELEKRPKKEREDMVAAVDLHRQKPKTERVNIVNEEKPLEELKTIASVQTEGDDETLSANDMEKKTDNEKHPDAVAMQDNPLNFRIVEQLPEFPGGMSAYVKWLTDNLRYPVAAQKKKIQGRVVVSFVINKDGSLSDIKVAKSADPLLDREALRVASMMPKWKPGIDKNKPCRTLFAVPIDFIL